MATDDSTHDTDAPDDDAAGRDGRLSPALLATLITIPVMVLAGFVTFAVMRGHGGTQLDSMAAAPGSQAACAPFLAALPDRLGDYRNKSVSGDTVRWRSDKGDVVALRCGVARPAALAPSSRLQVVDAAQWFITDESDSGVAYVAVDHRPYVALWLPRDSGPAPISEVTAVIDKHLQPGPLELH